MKDEDILALLATEEERAEARRLLALIGEAEATGAPQWSEFLDPAAQTRAGLLLQRSPGLAYDLAGGYAAAERRRLVLRPRSLRAEEAPPHIAAVRLEGDFPEAPSRQDLLGAVLRLGIKAGKVGDVVPDAAGGTVFLVEELAPTVEERLLEVAGIPVTAREVAPEEVAAPAERKKEVRATVAGLRLDAVAAAGFGTSRTQMSREIKGLRVRLNWRPAADPDAEVKVGDVIALRGRGRLVVAEITGTTKKGRLGVRLERYF
ncbi:MAG TPA: photosystem II S4 domain protein [Firmicutes bacterium]|nr:photosystem II S4 domain protein [Bacillota bacterium]